MRAKWILLFAAISSWCADQSNAALVRIIHTGDLHSHFEHATDESRGGFAAVKGVINELRAQATASNVPSLVLDAGDFSEGAEFYFAERGLHSFKILNTMGYSAVALGNHDWLMGAPRLSEILTKTRPQQPFLAANFTCHGLSLINQYVRPFHTVEVSGVKIAILGLTTNEDNYSWVVKRHCKVSDPIRAAKDWVPRLKKSHHAVIALTHLGLDVDRKLIEAVAGIDLVVGGHSHDLLKRPDVRRNRNGTPVSIMHSGRHGENVGVALIDVTPHFPINVLNYNIVPVHSRGSAHDAHTQAAINEARLSLRASYGGMRMDEIIGYSHVRRAPPESEQTEWGDFVVEAMRKAGRAEIGLNFTQFNGVDMPAGPIARSDLMRLYPRQFETERRLGWSVWTAEIPGSFLELILREAYKDGYTFSVAGIEVVTETNSRTGKPEIKSILRNGRKLNPAGVFKVAGPEGLVRGGLEVQPFLTGIAFEHPTDTGVPVWRALEQLLNERREIYPYPPGARRTVFNSTQIRMMMINPITVVLPPSQ